MNVITTSAFAGALALVGLAAATPACALPASLLAPIASDAASAASTVEHVRYHRVFGRHRYYARPALRRGWRGGDRHGYRRRGPIRRILRAL